MGGIGNNGSSAVNLVPMHLFTFPLILLYKLVGFDNRRTNARPCMHITIYIFFI